MFEIEKHFTFHAAHQLQHHDGPCSRLHGHSYKLIVRIRAAELHEEGSEKNMVIDFSYLKIVVRDLINNHLEHRFLNETLQTDSPTAEFIAAWIFRELKKVLPNISSVTLFETATSAVTFYE